MAEPITVTIKKNTGTPQSVVSTAPAKPQQAQAQEQGKSAISSAVIAQQAINYGKQFMVQGAKVYGDISGDYRLTNAISIGMDILGDATTMLINPVVGIPAVIFKRTMQAVSSFVETTNNNKRTSYNAQTMGYIAYNTR